ncbi:hypothetical protein PoB_007187800 [Plakobranchus ocellatus]|uniref:Uncharacterized protein n=1 Tax=Plakobranchus ocellatus TaxID=259542 RepID=A0AAV4DM46_9GAST|nr:hypothetical protein PoB_007187800 [Plakobranchus ocellatus]
MRIEHGQLIQRPAVNKPSFFFTSSTGAFIWFQILHLHVLELIANRLPYNVGYCCSVSGSNFRSLTVSLLPQPSSSSHKTSKPQSARLTVDTGS